MLRRLACNPFSRACVHDRSSSLPVRMPNRNAYKGPPAPWPFSSNGGGFVNPFALVDSAMRQMQNEMGRWFGHQTRDGYGENNSQTYRPFTPVEHPTDTELYRLVNPIIEENGVKKFKLEFDVRRFKPEDVKISTNAHTRCLSIDAKKEDENSKFEYCRKITIPDGVRPNEITCNFRSNGVLVFEAPYYEPAKIETREDKRMEIKHE